jgi:hypothetical protein
MQCPLSIDSLINARVTHTGISVPDRTVDRSICSAIFPTAVKKTEATGNVALQKKDEMAAYG